MFFLSVVTQNLNQPLIIPCLADSLKIREANDSIQLVTDYVGVNGRNPYGVVFQFCEWT